LWLIGLGHLGQAYLRALGLLPFARPQDLSLILQDIDNYPALNREHVDIERLYSHQY